ncbi:MAG: GAF domain-containing protein [Anaerolineae bacterium]|nr:MAG: GAF domain-containing protein [Anaerolineae bacterium]
MAEFGSSNLLRFLQGENRRLQEENDQLREEVTALRGYMDALRDLHRVARTINVEDEVMPVLSQILYAALTVTDSSAGSLLLRDPETDELVFVLVHGGRQDVLQGYRLAKGAGVVGWAATHKEPVIVNQPRQDWRFSSQVDETFSFETQNLMALPLIARGRVLGVLEVLNKFSGEGYTDSDLDLLSLLGLVSAEVLAVMETQSVEG